MKLFKRKNIGIGLAILLLYGCGGQQDTFQEFVKDGETVYIGRPEVRAVPSGENKVKFFVTINSDPKINAGKVLNVLGEEVHKFVVDRKTLTDNTLSFEITNDKEGNQLYKVILMNEQGTYKSMSRELTVNVLGKRYVRTLKTRTVKVGVSGKGVIFDWGDTLVTSYASFIAYTNTAGKAMTAEVSKKVKKEGEETINKQTILTDVKLGTLVKVHTGYRHSKDAGSFYSKSEEYKVEKPVITSISPLQGEPESDITITGRNFHPIAKNNKVLFGTLEVVPVSSTANATSRLIVKVPEKAKPGDYAITIKVGETTIPGKTFKVLPAKVKLLDRTKMKALKLTGDTGSAWGWVLARVIDGNTEEPSGFHNPLSITSVIVPPYAEAFSMFTIDMGVVAKLDKIKWWQRTVFNTYLKKSRAYNEGNPYLFDIWGTDKIPADKGASMATGWTRLIKDGEVKRGSVEDAKKGHEYMIDAKHPAVRYIRFVNQKSWNGRKWMHVMELKMWGIEVK